MPAIHDTPLKTLVSWVVAIPLFSEFLVLVRLWKEQPIGQISRTMRRLMDILDDRESPKSQKVQLMEQGNKWGLKGTSMSTWAGS